MKVFGLTVLAKDTVGLHYINHTVAAMSLAEADNIIGSNLATQPRLG